MTQSGSNEGAGVREGDILAGKYRVERVLGRGGMGVVVAAHHMQLDEKVALKFLVPEALGDAEAVARFAREARNAVKIKSEHVARVTDVGTLPNGAPYMVMEYLDGGDLAAWIKQRGALPIEQAIEFVLQACVAVAEAHALGIVHRDLKPANLFCVRRADGLLSIKVLDFGISKLTERIGSIHGTMTAQGMAFTKTSAMMGSPLYMSPEQMRSSKDVDAQTDIWALGVILFELITGKPPFHAESVTELAIKVNNEPTPAIRSFRPDVAGGIATWQSLGFSFAICPKAGQGIGRTDLGHHPGGRPFSERVGSPSVSTTSVSTNRGDADLRGNAATSWTNDGWINGPQDGDRGGRSRCGRSGRHRGLGSLLETGPRGIRRRAAGGGRRGREPCGLAARHADRPSAADGCETRGLAARGRGGSTADGACFSPRAASRRDPKEARRAHRSRRCLSHREARCLRAMQTGQDPGRERRSALLVPLRDLPMNPNRPKRRRVRRGHSLRCDYVDGRCGDRLGRGTHRPLVA